MRIDAHQHFWRPERGDYGWLDGAPAALRRVFLPRQLDAERRACGIDATVLVQAAPSIDETHYLLGMADACPWIAGVVGWIDFEDASQRGRLDRLAAHPRLVGLRPMVQDIADDRWILSDRLGWAFEAMQSHGLCFDALGFPRHAPHFLAIAQRHPELRMVLDHGLKPAIRGPAFDIGWARDMRKLAAHGNVMCKLSGLPSEASPDATQEHLRPYVEHLLDCFGPERLMWGSDWPVSSSSLSCGDWLRLCESLLSHCGDEARRRVFGLNALAFYGLQDFAAGTTGAGHEAVG